MQRFALPIVIAIAALLTGIGIGRYTTSSSEVVSTRNPAGPSEPAATNPINLPAVSSRNPLAPSASAAPDAAADSPQNIIAKIKAALTHSSSRHTYATFSKLAETVDATNVREVLGVRADSSEAAGEKHARFAFRRALGGARSAGGHCLRANSPRRQRPKLGDDERSQRLGGT